VNQAISVEAFPVWEQLLQKLNAAGRIVAQKIRDGGHEANRLMGAAANRDWEADQELERELRHGRWMI